MYYREFLIKACSSGKSHLGAEPERWWKSEPYGWTPLESSDCRLWAECSCQVWGAGCSCQVWGTECSCQVCGAHLRAVSASGRFLRPPSSNWTVSLFLQSVFPPSLPEVVSVNAGLALGFSGHLEPSLNQHLWRSREGGSLSSLMTPPCLS